MRKIIEIQERKIGGEPVISVCEYFVESPPYIGETPFQTKGTYAGYFNTMEEAIEKVKELSKKPKLEGVREQKQQ